MKRIALILSFIFSFQFASYAQGIINTIAGNGIPGYDGDSGLATNAKLWTPQGIYVDASGNIFIADYHNNVIRKVNSATNIITTIAGNGSAGYTGDGSLATNATLNGPTSVYLDASGNVYITDAYNNVVRQVNSATGIITTITGDGTSGYGGDGGPATGAVLSVPTGIYIDHTGNIFIAEFGNHIIRKITSATGTISTVAGNLSPGYSGDGGPATMAQLDEPNGVCVDMNGNIYIADTYNNRIREVNATTGVINTIAGTDTYGYSGDGDAATNAKLFFPIGIFVDSFFNAYIADGSNNVVREVVNSSGIITTIAGDGTSGFFGDGGTPTSAEFSVVSSVFIQSGNIFIADAFNNRIREITNNTTETPTTIKDIKAVLYPNPTNDIVNVSNLTGNTSFCLFDVTGNCLLKGILNKKNSSIPMKTLSSGSYILELNNGDIKQDKFTVTKE